MERIDTDILIIGAGSAGVGAAARALALSKENIKVTVIEKNPALGGTSTLAGVNCWEPGIGGPGMHKRIAGDVMGDKKNAGVGRTTVFATPEKPWGLSQIDESERYENTLRRSGLQRVSWRRFHFEPGAMSAVMGNLLSSYANARILLHTECKSVERKGSRIESVTAWNHLTGETYEIRAEIFIDASADIIVAREAGCGYTMGEEAASVYEEPSAPEHTGDIINGVTLLFRVAPASCKNIDPIPQEFRNIDVGAWAEKVLYKGKLYTQMNEYPNGDLNMNMLPTMEGNEFLKLGREQAIQVCRARAWHYWNWLQTEKGFEHFAFKSFFPEPGVRETYRLKGMYVLNEKDIRSGFRQQKYREEVIAFGDHALDTHGRTNIKGPKCGELDEPHGIPYRCLLPKELENLIVACRGSSFSHIAASSCRLSRTMLALGEAAGAAAITAASNRVTAQEISPELLRQVLGMEAFEEEIMKNWGL